MEWRDQTHEYMYRYTHKHRQCLIGTQNKKKTRNRRVLHSDPMKMLFQCMHRTITDKMCKSAKLKGNEKKRIRFFFRAPSKKVTSITGLCHKRNVHKFAIHFALQHYYRYHHCHVSVHKQQ